MLCDGCEVGEEGGCVPENVFGKVKLLLVTSEKYVIAMIATTGVAWVIAVTDCM
jgi:hypothetical protein